MAGFGPELFAEVLVPLVLALWWFVWEREEYPHGHVHHQKEQYKLTTWLRPLKFPGVAATSETIYYEGRLNHHLERLKTKRFGIVKK